MNHENKRKIIMKATLSEHFKVELKGHCRNVKLLPRSVTFDYRNLKQSGHYVVSKIYKRLLGACFGNILLKYMHS